MIWKILITGALVAFAIFWWNFRYDYRLFQKRYNVKLPFLCTVTLTNERDRIMRGVRRHRFIRKDGYRDMRRSMNFKVTYPTILIISHFKVKVWDLKKSNDLFLYLEPYMELPLDECPYWGEIKEDMWVFFHGNQLLFQRYIGKLMQFNGMPCQYGGGDIWHLVATRWGEIWYVHCLLKREPVYVRDVQKVLADTSVTGRRVIATNTHFSNGAKELAFANKIALIDAECIRRTFLHEEVMMM